MPRSKNTYQKATKRMRTDRQSQSIARTPNLAMYLDPRQHDITNKISDHRIMRIATKKLINNRLGPTPKV